MTKVVESVRSAWWWARDHTNAYLANSDPLAAAANTGAFIVWGNQPFYPIYVWMLVGHDAWPSLLTWLSTPAFVYVPLLSRKNSIAGRALFVIAGVANTLLSVKAFGPATQVGWFLVPCLILAAGFFRWREWAAGLGLTLMTLTAAMMLGFLGAPLHAYSEAQSHALAGLNLWGVSVLSVYLCYAAFKSRVAKRSGSIAR